MPLQLIHLTGDVETSATVRETCREAKVACYVTEFEKEMGYIWKAADLFIGRAGASTLTEMIAFEIPGILIPYPHSSKAHQQKNAEFLENEVKGGVCLLEKDASAKKLFELLQNCQSRLKEFKQALSTYNRTQYTETLGKCIYDLLSAR
jgi:UDP-N-acetylglucosamine--N-acetylmuramyl-(pentapeptide) pyrophosphoryl-undecaprenol N-acetylglucosamine transferase